MNNKRTNRCRLLASVGMLFILLFASFMPFLRALPAAAEEDDPVVKELYYITDNSKASTYTNAVSQLLADDGITLNVHLTMCSEGQVIEKVSIGLAAGEYHVQNAYFVIEMGPLPLNSRGLVSSGYKSSLLFIFSTLKAGGNKIMFINGTDEARFRNPSFLQYVDVHVNNDYFTPFVISAFYVLDSLSILDMFSDKPRVEDLVFLLDESFLCEYSYQFCFLHMIRSIFAMMNVSDVYLDNILAGKNVEFFVYNAEGKINKIYDSSTLGTDQDEDWFLDYSSSFDYVITFCSTKTSNYLDFVDFTKLMRLYSIQTFNFILNDGADYPYSVNQDYERLAGIHEDKYDEYLTDMLYLFLVDDYLSLENYDAWIGVCGVTFRPFYPGPGGWILSNYTTDEDGTIGFN